MNLSEKEISDYCRRCGDCCKIEGYVFISEKEAKTIAEYLNTDIYDFTDKYCKIVERKKLALKDKHGENTCIFLNENGCMIYDVRPEQCKKFPYNWSNGELPDRCIYKKIK